jgi:subtilase family serine protease
MFALTLLGTGLGSATGQNPESSRVGAINVPGSVAGSDSDVITFYYGLKRPEKRAKKALRRVSNPKSSTFRMFIDRARIASEYGVSSKTLKKFSRSTSKYGLRTELDRSGVFVRVTGTVSSMSDWLKQPIERQTIPGSPALVLYSAATGAKPPDVKGLVRESVSYYSEMAAVATKQDLKPIQPNQGTYIGGCKAAKAANTYSFKQLARAYGVRTKRNDTSVGRDIRMAIISLGNGYSEASLREAAKCFKTPKRSFKRIRTDGVTGPLPAGLEGELDTQVLQGALPKGSRIKVVESLPLLLNQFQAWARAFSLNKLPDVVSMSYVFCEEEVTGPSGDDFRTLIDSELIRLGLAGSSTMASSGDDGSSQCASSDPTATQLAVAYPASSPYITAVGGSRIVLNKRNQRKKEVVWKDVNRYVNSDGGAEVLPDGSGGGGQSTLYRSPWWQNPHTTESKWRTLPDISMHASFGPGWPVYTDGQGFQAVSGTSASSPYFGANIAMLAAQERQLKNPSFGHVAPALYVAKKSQKQSIYDIRQGNNALDNPDCCKATKGYDWASGLGAPNMNKLQKAFRDMYGVNGLG